jgi:hypothetical protein
LNVEADKLATRYMHEHPRTTSCVP